MADRPIAEKLAEKQKAVSVAEFFERNRHLLGFDNKRKALLTVVKEAVDNSLDACEEARILPEVSVQIIEMGNERFRIIVEDNGPGIVRKQIGNIFAKLLYGSKFHSLKQARGQQGIGISAAVLYAQLTTGRPARITTRIDPKHPAHYMELHLDTKTNEPHIIKDEEVQWKKERGTKVELDIEASYQKGDQSVDSYLKETAIVNPHATIVYTNPKAEQVIFPRASDKLPKEPQEIKPHPYGVELGIMLKMIRATESRTLQSFLMNEFSRVGSQTAKEICSNAGLQTGMKPRELELGHIEKLMEGIKKTKIISPPTDCIVPIGEELLEKGLRKEVAAEFYTAVTRPPEIYRGIPFVIEVALAYGGQQPKEETARILRFANRVPLLYQQSACSAFKSILQTNWKPYGMQQSGGAAPVGPLTVIVHLASVWPPFTSEAKEAIAHYPEIIKEIKLALQEAGRRLGAYVNKKKRVGLERERVNIFERYIPEVADSLAALSGENKKLIETQLNSMLAKNKEFIQAHASASESAGKQDKPEDDIALTGSAESDEE
jgi:DNA topoisomerase-6 subunit B